MILRCSAVLTQGKGVSSDRPAGASDDDEHMLLCDGKGGTCPRACHTYCCDKDEAEVMPHLQL